MFPNVLGQPINPVFNGQPVQEVQVFDFSFLIHSQAFCLDCFDLEDEMDSLS
jgi:hypothetical protein